VARWAAGSIEMGPGTRCKPWVVGPANAPIITDLQEAEENVELAVQRRSWICSQNHC
jgi:hypothetical protein